MKFYILFFISTNSLRIYSSLSANEVENARQNEKIAEFKARVEKIEDFQREQEQIELLQRVQNLNIMGKVSYSIQK